jgi:hypothetical protein
MKNNNKKRKEKKERRKQTEESLGFIFVAEGQANNGVLHFKSVKQAVQSIIGHVFIQFFRELDLPSLKIVDSNESGFEFMRTIENEAETAPDT